MDRAPFFPDAVLDNDSPALKALNERRCYAEVWKQAREILVNPLQYEWSLQGFGLLRLHISEIQRLHIWDPTFAVPNVSLIHDHLQWGLHSTILAGKLHNYRYVEDLIMGDAYEFATIKAGYGAFMKSTPEPIRLHRQLVEVYEPGDSYSQRPSEIHHTEALPGTVTMMFKRPTADADSARVFWEEGKKWVDAIPRIATAEEVITIIRKALEWPELSDLKEEFEGNLAFLGACGDQVRKLES